jgi:TBC1 domain family protein 5
VIEANYSFALMLLLKYPSPESPNGPQKFVDDAIFLRDNFSAAGGATIISKYSGKTPSLYSSDSRPSTPLGQGLSHKRNISRTKSPLPSPARFLQQQGGVEALFQGAAKGVFDQGERLGINKAVRDAVGEVKKNMQGLQTSRNNSTKRRPYDVMRWSLDEGRPIPPSRASVSALDARNKQLARMLDQAMTGLRAVSASDNGNGNKDKYVEAMDLAIAKVEFVRVYLEDATMPLPEDSSHLDAVTLSPIPADTPPSPLQEPLQDTTLDPTVSPSKDSRIEKPDPEPMGKPLPSSPTSDVVISKDTALAASASTIPSIDLQQTTIDSAKKGGLQSRPTGPVPTRSTIAQSSFSWMLEPDAGSIMKSSPPKSSSPFLKSGRRPASGSGREKAAFLFGEVDDSNDNPSARSQSQSQSLIDAETFNLGTIRGTESK